jgi:hypothetical protein
LADSRKASKEDLLRRKKSEEDVDWLKEDAQGQNALDELLSKSSSRRKEVESGQSLMSMYKIGTSSVASSRDLGAIVCYLFENVLEGTGV